MRRVLMLIIQSRMTLTGPLVNLGRPERNISISEIVAHVRTDTALTEINAQIENKGTRA